MTSEEYKWTINLVKDRYHQFKLSFKQAEKVYHFEQEKDLHSEEYSFSVWEEYDYMLDNFQKILNEKQLKKFLTWHGDIIKRHEDYLIENDTEQIKYIDYYNELLAFYEQHFFPDFFKKEFLAQTVSLSFEKHKVEFLRKEYKAFLDSQKIGYISSHYRHSRAFQPNKLKLTLLRHKLYYIVPHFSVFRAKMDEPTKVVADFLLNKFQYIPELHHDFFKKKEEELISFVKNTWSKYFGKDPGGWAVVGKQTEQQEKENQIMQVILMDKEKYGC